MSKSKGGKDTISIKRFKNGGIYIKPSKKDMLQHYDLGGLFNGVLSGGIKGSTSGPAGIVGGALLGGVSSLLGNSVKNKQEDEMKRQQFLQNRNIENQNFLQSLPQQQQYQPTFTYGGVSKYPEGGKTKKDPKLEQSVKVSTTFADPYENLRKGVLSGGIDAESLYENPDKLSEYYNMLAGENMGKGENPTPYQQRYITNYNNRYAKDTGYSYDPNARSLRVNPDSFKWKPVNPNTIDTTSNSFKPVNWRNPVPYNPNGNNNFQEDTGTPLGGGTFGVGKTQKKQFSLGGALHQGTGANINYITQYPFGGIQPNAELEQGEPFRTPNGDINQVSNNAPTHEQGGVPLNLPENTQILGKMVDPMLGKQFKQLGEQLKRAQDRYKKVLDEKPTPLTKKTAKMMLDKVQSQYDQLMQRQESMKGQQSQTQQFPYGGMPLMQNGRVVQYADGGLNKISPIIPSGYNNPQLAPMNIPYSVPPPIREGISLDKLGDIGNAIGSIAPIAYNLGQGLFGKTKQLNPSDYRNPYTNQINSLMANRRYDISPELETNRQATAQYYQNLRQAAPSQSRYLAGLQSGQISSQRANQDVYSKVNNVNNQYKAEQAGMLQGLGQQEVNTKLGVEDINTRTQAIKNQYLPTALSQLQQLTQIRQLMKGQKKQDKQKLAIAKEMFKNYPFDITKILE